MEELIDEPVVPDPFHYHEIADRGFFIIEIIGEQLKNIVGFDEEMTIFANMAMRNIYTIVNLASGKKCELIDELGWDKND